jgi:hypothetical protein
MFFVKTILKAAVIGCRTTSRMAADQYSTCSAAAVCWPDWRPGCRRGVEAADPLRVQRRVGDGRDRWYPDLVSRDNSMYRRTSRHSATALEHPVV